MRKLVQKIGINDVKGISKTKVYRSWNRMLERAYSSSFHILKPTYKNCEVDIRWQRLSEFKKWFDVNYIEGYALDKDIYLPNNKVYSPDLCVFAPDYVNNLISNPNSKGWSIRKGKYRAQISINGKDTKLGTCDTKEEANILYKNAKIDMYINEGKKWKNTNNKIYIGLCRHAKLLK